MTKLGQRVYVRNLVGIARVLGELVADLDRGVAVNLADFEHDVERATLFVRV